MQPRTRRQREVLNYLTYFIEEHGYEPSYQQIARHFRIASKSAIAKHVAALESQGMLTRQRENGSFGLQLHSQNSVSDLVCEIQWLEIPSNENLREDWELAPLFVPRFLLGIISPELVWAFRVRDDSMIDEHICEGDVALIEKRSSARDGDHVLALIENKKIILNRFFRKGANVELHPANSKRQTVHLPADKVSILGVLRGILRPLT